MDSSSMPMPVYEDFEVHTEWVHEIAEDTLIAYLPGFNKQQLKVQVTTGGKLRISGERPIGGNKIRFSKEIPIPSNCDQNKIRANFRGGMLYIKHPKLIVPADEIQQEQVKPSADIPKSDQKLASDPQPQKPADVPQEKIDGLKQAVQEAPPKATMEEKTGDEKTDRVAKQTEDVSEKIPDKEEEMKGKSNAAAINEHDKLMEKEEKSWDQEEKTASSCEKCEKLDESLQELAAKKEEVDTKKLDGAIDKYQPVIDINMVWLKYKQVLDGIKNPRKMMNMVLAVLLVVVLAVYLRNAIWSLRD